MSYSSEVLADSPLAYYRQGEASGTTMTDSSGNARDGTYANVTLGTAGLLSGDSDTAATYDGTSSSGTVAYAAWQSPAVFTFEALISPSAVSGTHTIASRHDVANGSTWTFRLEGTSLKIYLWTSSSAFVSATASTTFAAGSKYHVAVAYDGTTVTIYVAGSSVGSVAGTIYNAGTGPLRVGSANGGASEFFGGVIDEAAFYGTALSSTRIAAHAAAVNAVASSGGTVAAVSGVSGTVTGRYPASGSIAATSGVSGSATLVPQSSGGTVQVLSSVIGSASVVTVPVYTFTPPTTTESSSDLFFGRYRVPVGISVIWDGTTFVSQPYPWLGDLVNLTEGETWFQGGRTYQVDETTAGLLQNAGFSTSSLGYGSGAYGIQGYGGNL